MLVNFAGAQVGGYTLEAEIGRGGMSRVYRASRPNTTQQFAIKVVNHLTTRDDKFEQRFWREIAVVNRLSHPSILPVLASGQEMDGMLYMVMPLIEGGSLKELLINQGALTPSQIKQMVNQMASALDYAHTQGIVHRDVKPHNMMQIGPDQWVLTDFGVAAMSSLEETVSNLTSTGATLGTFAYMSPEQISGGEIDGRADFYSLGVVIYQALIGRLPFVGDNTAVVLSQQLHTLPIEPHLISPKFPQEIEAVLMKTLAKRPEHRFQTGAELITAFNDAFDTLSPDQQNAPLVTPQEAEGAGTLANIPVATVTEPPADKRVSRRMVLAAVAAVLLAIAACVVIVMPLQAQLAEAQGTAAALGSRTPVIVTQMVTNAAGEQVFIMVTAAEGTPTATPGTGQTATLPGPTPTKAPTQTRAAPTATGAPATASGGSSGGQGGATVAPQPTSGPQPTSADATAPGNSGNSGTPDGGGAGNSSGAGGGSDGGSNAGGGGNSGGGNNGGGNNGGGNGGGKSGN